MTTPALTAATLQAGNEDNPILYVVITILGAAHAILWIAALISILRSDRLTGGGKLLWFAVITGFAFLGPLSWFIFGRKAQLVKTGVTPSVGT